MEESLDKILQHQRLTYEMMAVLFGEEGGDYLWKNPWIRFCSIRD